MDLKLFESHELEILLDIARNPLLEGKQDASGMAAANLEGEILSEIKARQGGPKPWQAFLKALKK